MCVPPPGRATTLDRHLECCFIVLCVSGVAFYDREHPVDKFSTKHVYDTHCMLSFLEFAFVIFFVFAFLHLCRHIDRVHVQMRFYGLARTLGYLGF